jgi:hypothetical protein
MFVSWAALQTLWTTRPAYRYPCHLEACNLRTPQLQHMCSIPSFNYSFATSFASPYQCTRPSDASITLFENCRPVYPASSVFWDKSRRCHLLAASTMSTVCKPGLQRDEEAQRQVQQALHITLGDDMHIWVAIEGTAQELLANMPLSRQQGHIWVHILISRKATCTFLCLVTLRILIASVDSRIAY